VVNASLNWASIVGIVLAVGGALLYFMRSFKPALARDYDVFFAAVGLLCGGILFFQGWRLDPILQFGQFLLAGTTVFFAYESVRLRGVTTEQARRSSYFDDDEPPAPYRPQMGGGRWDGGVDRLDEPQPVRRRIRSREEEQEEADDFYRPRRPSRAAIPERAASRREARSDWDNEPVDRSAGREGFNRSPAAAGSTRATDGGSDFGARRRDRDNRPEARRGSRVAAADEGTMPRSSRRAAAGAPRPPLGEPIGISDAEFRPVGAPRSREPGAAPEPTAASGPPAPARPPIPPQGPSARDNSSRFDD